jgi:hypothetical protein
MRVAGVDKSLAMEPALEEENVGSDVVTEKPLLFDTVQAASLIGATYNVLKLSRLTGEIYKGIRAPLFVKMGRAVRYRRSDLVEWIAQQKRYKKTSDYPNKNELTDA